jgi:hypothetical protein
MICRSCNKKDSIELKGEIWPDEATCVEIRQCKDCKDVTIFYDHTRRQKKY